MDSVFIIVATTFAVLAVYLACVSLGAKAVAQRQFSADTCTTKAEADSKETAAAETEPDDASLSPGSNLNEDLERDDMQEKVCKAMLKRHTGQDTVTVLWLGSYPDAQACEKALINCRIHVVSTGDQAIDFLKEQGRLPDIMAIQLSACDVCGYDLCKSLRKEMGIPSVIMPVILLLEDVCTDAMIWKATRARANDLVISHTAVSVLSSWADSARRRTSDYEDLLQICDRDTAMELQGAVAASRKRGFARAVTA